MNETDTDRERLREWWRTEIIDIEPGEIRLRGYPIEQLIGERSFAAVIWLMLRGELPTPGQARLLEAALVAAVDHGPQAPAIAIARMAATCGVGINNALASGVNALGDVHGGAGEQAMSLYADIAVHWDEQGVDEATAAGLARWRAMHGKYIPGFGHRFHPRDPRAVRLGQLLDGALAAGEISGRYLAIGRAVEQALSARGNRAPLPMNIDGITAVVFSELGFAPTLGRGLFLLARSVGILAHASEQASQGGRIKGPTPPDFGYRYGGESPRNLPPAPPAGEQPDEDIR